MSTGLLLPAAGPACQLFCSGIEGEAAHAKRASVDLLDNNLLSTVLSVLPAPDLLLGTSLVSRRWHALSEDHYLWSQRLLSCLSGQDARSTMQRLLRSLPPPRPLVLRLCHTNLLRSPNFEHERRLSEASGQSVDPAHYGATAASPWRQSCRGGQGWGWVQAAGGSAGDADNQRSAFRPPAALPPFDAAADGGVAAAGPPFCAAASYRWCELVQEVDLVEELSSRGVSREAAAQLLDSALALQFHVWVGASSGCKAEYSVQVVLDDGRLQFPPYTGRSDYEYHRAALTQFCSQPTSLEAGQWRRVAHTFAGYGPGVRRCIVALRGRDSAYWVGHHGARFTACQLSVACPTDAAGQTGGELL